MSTTNTDGTWYWYIRLKEDRGYIGIVDNDGDPTDTSAYTIQIWGDQTPDEVTATTDTLPIPVEHELGFIKGCVDELLQMHGIDRPKFTLAYEEAINDAIHRRVDSSEHPLVLKPLDLRDD